MMGRRWRCFTAVACMSMSTMSVAQSFIHFGISNIPINFDDSFSKIIAPRFIDPPGYSSVLQLSSDGVNFCTWFMVSEKTLVGAAHCLVGGRRRFMFADGLYSATCSVPLDFGIGRQLDLAMCLLSKPYQMSPGDGFERVLRDEKYVKTGKSVEIGGYGCHHAGESVEKKYATGESKIYQLNPGVHLPGSDMKTPNLIKIKGTPSFLCSGDSGGPVFLTPSNGGGRRVMGVNSATVFDIEASYITSLLTDDSRKFIAAWSSKTGQKICGIDDAASGCRR